MLTKKRSKMVIIIVLILILLTVIFINIIDLILFKPLYKNNLSKVEISKYNNEGYTELIVSDDEELSTLLDMKNSITNNATIFNSKIQEAETFQKDSEYVFCFVYDNGIHQTIEITGNNTIIFNYCNSNEFPKYYLNNKSSNYEISLCRDGLVDYGLQLFYGN